MREQWSVSLDGTQRTIEYLGCRVNGIMKILVDGELYEYVPTIKNKIGFLVKLDIPGHNVILNVSPNRKKINLIVNGYYADSWLPADEQLDLDEPSVLTSNNAYQENQEKIGLKSLFSFVLLSYLNLVLLIINADISFPFSAMLSRFPLLFGKVFYEHSNHIAFYVVGIFLSVLLCSVYAVLYVLSKKRIAPVYITLVLVIIDTAAMFLFHSFPGVLVDLVFHAWVIFALVNLLRTKLHMKHTQMGSSSAIGSEHAA